MGNKTILLTGGTGFLGSSLLRELLNNNYSVIVLKRSFSDVSKIKDCLNNPNAKFYDIDKIELSEIFKQNKIRAIIHCATDYGRNGNCAKVLTSNLIFPVELLESATKHNVDLFINTDSYFNKENLSYMYLQNYSLSKKTLRLWLKAFSKQIKVINAVLEHIYGINDNPEKFVSSIIKSIAIDKVKVLETTQGDQKRDFIYVKDVCDCYIKLLEYGLKHSFRYRTLDIGTGNATKIKDFICAVKKISKSDTKIDFGALPYRDDEIMISKADTTDTIELGWEPKYTIEQGIKEIIDFEREKNKK